MRYSLRSSIRQARLDDGNYCEVTFPGLLNLPDEILVEIIKWTHTQYVGDPTKFFKFGQRGLLRVCRKLNRLSAPLYYSAIDLAGAEVWEGSDGEELQQSPSPLGFSQWKPNTLKYVKSLTALDCSMDEVLLIPWAHLTELQELRFTGNELGFVPFEWALVHLHTLSLTGTFDPELLIQIASTCSGLRSLQLQQYLGIDTVIVDDILDSLALTHLHLQGFELPLFFPSSKLSLNLKSLEISGTMGAEPLSIGLIDKKLGHLPLDRLVLDNVLFSISSDFPSSPLASSLRELTFVFSVFGERGFSKALISMLTPLSSLEILDMTFFLLQNSDEVGPLLSMLPPSTTIKDLRVSTGLSLVNSFVLAFRAKFPELIRFVWDDDDYDVCFKGSLFGPYGY